MRLEHIQARGRLEVVHHDRTLARAYGQALRCHVEVDCRKTTRGRGESASRFERQWGKWGARFHNMAEDLGCRIEDGVTVCCGIRVQRFNYRFHELGKMRIDDEGFLKKIDIDEAECYGNHFYYDRPCE